MAKLWITIEWEWQTEAARNTMEIPDFYDEGLGVKVRVFL